MTPPLMIYDTVPNVCEDGSGTTYRLENGVETVHRVEFATKDRDIIRLFRSDGCEHHPLAVLVCPDTFVRWNGPLDLNVDDELRFCSLVGGTITVRVFVEGCE